MIGKKRISTIILAAILAVFFILTPGMADTKTHHQKSYCKSTVKYRKTYNKHHKIKHYPKYKHRKFKKYRYKRRYQGVKTNRGEPRTNWWEPTVREVGLSFWPEPAQLDALVWIGNHEGYPGAVNRLGCRGIFQLMNPPSWMVLGDPASETKAGCEYIKRRYGTPLNAQRFWRSRGWY